MKRLSLLLAVVLMVLATGYLCAQDAPIAGDDPSMAPPPAGEMKHEGKDDRMGKGPMMHKMGMGGISMVGTKDGGVILLVGKKLMKYDQNLELVKEVEIKMPCGEMMKKMKDCPKKEKKEEATSAATEAPVAP
jgi:hypothetical protein